MIGLREREDGGKIGGEGKVSSGSTAMDLLGDQGGDPSLSPAQSGPPAGGKYHVEEGR